MIATARAEKHINTNTSTEKIDCLLKKRARLIAGNPPRLLDLFSGCGGLSLGFHKAGFEIVAAIDIDKDAINTHAKNFHWISDFFNEHAKPRDIIETDPNRLFRDLGLKGNCADLIDVIVGGPPCQAFTRVGRAKLREIKRDSNAFLNDSRSQLYKRYLEYVAELKPLAILMENVPDVLNYGGINIADLVCEDLATQGYKCAYTLLNTVFYGVPQMRERMFLIAIHECLNGDMIFPAPTHRIELPSGYHGSRNVALRHINPESNPFYVEPPPISNDLAPAISVEQALSDLPLITEHLKKKLNRCVPDLSKTLKYSSTTGTNSYQILMREWIPTEDPTVVSGNAIRFLPRDYPIFKRMKPGDQYPQALTVAKSIFKRKLEREQRMIGKNISKSSRRYQELLQETVPPYDARKFPNKWRKMEAEKPARTLMAHLGKDSYSHIHYDSRQARTISVREAARLQTFPDGFQFSGSMNAAFRQIGNAVPPLMAEKIASSIKQILHAG